MPEELRRRMAELPFRELYEVGGSLRDELLGREPKDVDFLVRGHDVEELLTLCRQYGKADELRVAGRLVGVRFWPRWGPQQGIEIVPPRRETPIAAGEPDFTGNPHTDFRIEPDPELPVRDDLERRDFTVNAMARDVRTQEWIDPFGGREDLRARVLRAVHETAFRDDPLRILRGVARSSLDGLEPDPRTRSLMEAAAPRIAELSAERVREELERTFAGPSVADALRLARDVGALQAAMPEWASCIGVDQHSETQAYTLDEHILHVLDAAVHEHAGRELRLAAFWHDVGKPYAPGARPHAEEGAHITRAALRRLTYDNDTVAIVCDLVREHSYSEDRDPSPHAARLFLSRVGRDRARDLLALRRCDRIGRGVPIPAERVAKRKRFEALVEQEWGQPVALPDLAVRGDDLMAAGVPEGPAIGATLRRLLAAVVDDPSLNQRETLLRLALNPESID
ncbi:MAG TPA: HD domain-containing protein [Gaiellales bacterium]|jgi:tRNA nucleotidyltransferase/poly(A) polymerase|nr:HD domain-containing protein [Gaiellales bacterium]